MKIKKRVYITVSLILLSIGLSCERDDICVDAPVTPKLIIRFQNSDVSSAGVDKPVQSLQVTLVNDAERKVFQTPVSGDSILIPLDFAAEKTQFVFTRNVDDLNTDNTASDTLEFTYTTNQEFVNRACGFRSTFSNLNSELTSTNWIKRVEVVKEDVNDQESAHIRLFH